MLIAIPFNRVAAGDVFVCSCNPTGVESWWGAARRWWDLGVGDRVLAASREGGWVRLDLAPRDPRQDRPGARQTLLFDPGWIAFVDRREPVNAPREAAAATQAKATAGSPPARPGTGGLFHGS